MARKSKGGRRPTKPTSEANGAPYRVGYGRPPRQTQFKPNQSGNPAGRPRRIPTLRAVVEKVLEERIEIREGERVLRMSNRHALVRTAVRRALNGDPKLLRALSHVLRLESEGGQLDADADKIVSAADEAILADFIMRHGIEDSRAADQPDQTKAQQLTAPDAPGRKRSQS